MSRLIQSNQHQEGNTIRISYILTGVLIAYAISLLVFLVTAFILNITNIPDVIIPHLTYVTSVVSIVVGAMHATKQIGERGWLNGGICGLLYFFGLLALTVLIGIELASNEIVLSRLFLAFVFGAIGGVLGINT